VSQAAPAGGVSAARHLDRRLVAVMAVATGLTVANNYYYTGLTMRASLRPTLR